MGCTCERVENGVSKATNYSAGDDSSDLVGFSCSIGRISWPLFIADENVSLPRIKPLTFPCNHAQPVRHYTLEFVRQILRVQRDHKRDQLCVEFQTFPIVGILFHERARN